MGTGKGTERTGCAEGTALARSEGRPEEAERTRGPLLLGPCLRSACAVPHGLSHLPPYSHRTGRQDSLQLWEAQQMFKVKGQRAASFETEASGSAVGHPVDGSSFSGTEQRAPEPRQRVGRA